MQAGTILIIAAAAIFAASICSVSASRTIRDVKQCYRDNIAEFSKACKSKLPKGKRVALIKCIKNETKEGFQKVVADCLVGKGIKDDDDCFNIEPTPGQGPKRIFWELGMFPTIRLPLESVYQLREFQECATSALENKDGCTKECGPGEPTSGMTWFECAQKAVPKEGETNELTECVKAALA